MRQGNYREPNAISIHAPRAGSDANSQTILQRYLKFQSTLPVRGATYANGVYNSDVMISIHAPRAGSDARIVPACSSRSTFQSTLPVRGATQKGMNYDKVLNISIHAPRAGSDNSRAVGFPFKIHFNPRSPCGERLLPIAFSLALVYFNPRSPCGERLILWEVHSCNFNFNPRSPCGERPASQPAVNASLAISIHAPRAGSDEPYI